MTNYDVQASLGRGQKSLIIASIKLKETLKMKKKAESRSEREKKI